MSAPFKEGDVLVSTWGYDARLATFWKVLKVTAKTVKIVELKDQRHTGDWFKGTSEPILNDNYGKVENPRIKDFRSDGVKCLKTKDYGYAYLWDGKPVNTYNHH